jgi:hypothetical protein
MKIIPNEALMNPKTNNKITIKINSMNNDNNIKTRVNPIPPNKKKTYLFCILSENFPMIGGKIADVNGKIVTMS